MLTVLSMLYLSHDLWDDPNHFYSEAYVLVFEVAEQCPKGDNLPLNSLFFSLNACMTEVSFDLMLECNSRFLKTK